MVRADSVRLLSDDGLARRSSTTGSALVVDLRGDHEREDDPPAELPVEVVHVPFMEASDAEWEEIAAELETATAVAPDDATATRDAYLIFLEHFKDNVAASVRAVAHAPEGGVVIHCVGGKDRTGLLTAFLLHLAGVDDETIAAGLRAERGAAARAPRSVVRGRGVRGGAAAPAADRADPAGVDARCLHGA